MQKTFEELITEFGIKNLDGLNDLPYNQTTCRTFLSMSSA